MVFFLFGDAKLVSFPACAHLPARNRLVNEVEFLRLIYPKQVMTNEITRSVIIT